MKLVNELGLFVCMQQKSVILALSKFLDSWSSRKLLSICLFLMKGVMISYSHRFPCLFERKLNWKEKEKRRNGQNFFGGKEINYCYFLCLLRKQNMMRKMVWSQRKLSATILTTYWIRSDKIYMELKPNWDQISQRK